MKILGSGNSHFHAGKRIVTRSLEIFFLACWLLTTSDLASISTSRLKEIAFAYLSPETPGLEKVIAKINNPDGGFAFETEAALVLMSRGERILGFELDLTLCNEAFIQCPLTVSLDGKFNRTELRTTEFDIITTNHAVECKRGHHAKIFQLNKERTMLVWCQELVREFEAGQIELDLTYSRMGKTFIVLNGPATCYQNIYITSAWLEKTPQKDWINQFKEIVHVLANKEQITLFGGRLDNKMYHQLTNAHINFVDNVSLAIS